MQSLYFAHIDNALSYTYAVVVASFGIWKMRKMQNARIDGARQVGQPPQQVEQAQAAGAARLAELEVGVQEGQQEHDHTAADSGSLYAATEETSRRPEQNGVSGIPTQEVGNLDVWPAGHRGGPYTVGVAVTRDTGGSEVSDTILYPIIGFKDVHNHADLYWRYHSTTVHV